MLVVEAFHQRLLGYLYIQTGSHDLADDLAQEVLLAAYEQRKAIRSEKALKSWLFTVACRKAARSQPRSRTQPLPEPGAADDPASPNEPSPWSGIQRQKSIEFMEGALRTLPAEERDLVTLRYFGELSIKELSETLQMPMGTVGVKLGRALEKMKKHLLARGVTFGDLLP